MAGLLAKIALACVIAGSAADSAAKPHILMILADDFGWADIGYHASKPLGGVQADGTMWYELWPPCDSISKRGRVFPPGT